MPPHKPDKPPDPVALLAEANDLKAQWIAKEREAIRAALEVTDWLVKPAAKLLGYPRHTSLIRQLEARHAELGEELRQRRQEKGYTSGNPSPMRNK